MRETFEEKRKSEKKMAGKMIRLYCKGQGHEKSGELCDSCQALYDYVEERVERCPFMREKTFCSNCKVHCYRGEIRERIKEVMRYAGPRLLLTDPVPALRHAFLTLKEKRKIRREDIHG